MKKRTFLFALFLGFVTMFSLAQAAAPSLTEQAATLAKAGNTAAVAKLAADNPTQAAAIAGAAAKAAPTQAAAIAAAVAKAVPSAAGAIVVAVQTAVPGNDAAIVSAVATATNQSPAQIQALVDASKPKPSEQQVTNQGNTPPVDPSSRNVSGS